MPVIEQSVAIARPAYEVFDFVARGENLPAWDSSVLECVKLDSGSVGIGTRYRGASKVLGRRIEWTTEVVEFELGVRSHSKSVEGALKFLVFYEVAPTPGGSQLCYRIVVDSGLGGAFGYAMEPIIEKAQARVVRQNLDRLAALLERRAA
jgi:uncharacterized membrane protein